MIIKLAMGANAMDANLNAMGENAMGSMGGMGANTNAMGANAMGANAMDTNLNAIAMGAMWGLCSHSLTVTQQSLVYKICFED